MKNVKAMDLERIAHALNWTGGQVERLQAITQSKEWRRAVGCDPDNKGLERAISLEFDKLVERRELLQKELVDRLAARG